jgi:thiamine kinase
MTESELRDFLSSQGLADSQTALRTLKGGYLNTVWRVDTGDLCFVAKEFAEPMTGTLFPNLPADEAEALRRLTGLDVAPDLVGFWPDASLLVYDFVEGDMWDGDMASVARLLLRKEAADPTGFRTVPLTIPDIVAEGDALFARCASQPEAISPPHGDVPPPQKLSLVHTDIGVNLVGAGSNLRLIDWQCPAIGDICEDIYSFLSPAFQILGKRAPLTLFQVRNFWQALARPDLEERYALLRPAYAWRFAGYCAWRADVLEDAAICARYRRALAEELIYMGHQA